MPPGARARWRRPTTGGQALLTPARLRDGHPWAQLAAGFGFGTTTAYRYIPEAIDLLTALAPGPCGGDPEASTKAFVPLGGTLPPIDRIAADQPFRFGKHTEHRGPRSAGRFSAASVPSSPAPAPRVPARAGPRDG